MRINFFAGAGSGKSTTAAWLFSELKRLGHSVELVSEYIKGWTYIDRKPRSFDQVYIFSKQLHYEDRVLASGVKNIVCDSPILLSPIYAKFYSARPSIQDALRELALEFDDAYPSISIFLERREKEFKKEGRWGTREEAERIDKEILEFLTGHYQDKSFPLLISNWHEQDAILKFALEHITK